MEKAAAMNDAVFAMLREARQKVGADKLVVFNPLHATDWKRPPLEREQLPVTDAAMIDDLDRGAKARQQSVAYMVNTLDAMRSAAKAGKVILFKVWPDCTRQWRNDPKVKKAMSLQDLRCAMAGLFGVNSSTRLCWSTLKIKVRRPIGGDGSQVTMWDGL